MLANMEERKAEDLWRLRMEARLGALQIMNTLLVSAVENRAAIEQGLKGALDAVASSAASQFDRLLEDELSNLMSALFEPPDA